MWFKDEKSWILKYNNYGDMDCKKGKRDLLLQYLENIDKMSIAN
jgi:hypothetical protein